MKDQKDVSLMVILDGFFYFQTLDLGCHSCQCHSFENHSPRYLLEIFVAFDPALEKMKMILKFLISYVNELLHFCSYSSTTS